MTSPIEQLYEARPIAEIIDISPSDREKFIAEAEGIMLNIYWKRVDGGNIADIYKAMIRSIIESYARIEAIENTGKCSIMDNDTYEDALKDFHILINTYSNNVDSLKDDWMIKVKKYIDELYLKIEKIYETYIIGELCEKMYLNSKGAKTVVQELINENYVKIIDYEYDTNLLVKIM